MNAESTSIFRRYLPFWLAVALIVLGNVNIQIRDFSPFPHFVSMMVFFWALYLPRVMTKLNVFILGILHDVLYGLPIGITSVALLVVWWLVVAQRRFLFKEPFWVIWLSYSIVLSGVMAFNVAAISLIYGEWMWEWRVVLLTLLSVGYYPFLHRLCMSFYNDFLRGMTDDTYV